MDLIGGHATADGTARFRDRAVSAGHAVAGHFRSTRWGLTLSSLGLGSYLGRPDSATDLLVEQAVGVAVRSGRINVIDTAINYRYQRAERSIGRQLSRMVSAATADREELFLATKGGYLAPDGEDPRPPQQWIDDELVQKGTLSAEEIVDGSHAMSPAYLADQLERSRQNLGVTTLDLFYLHNAADAQLASVGRPEFLRRLRQAFELLETERRRGHLVRYGLATWDSLRVPPSDPGYISLAELVAAAESVGGPDHGFQAVQFPFNTDMTEALTLANQPAGGRSVPLLQAAHHWGIHCFTSIPLSQGRLARSTVGRDGLTPAQTALQFARSAPDNTAALVGQKQPAHLSENLELAQVPPWSTEGAGRPRRTV